MYAATLQIQPLYFKRQNTPTCTIATEEADRGRHDSGVQEAESAKHQPDQGGFEGLRQQGEEEDRQVGQVAHAAQDGRHDAALGTLGHALDGGEEHYSLRNLKTKIKEKTNQMAAFVRGTGQTV